MDVYIAPEVADIQALHPFLSDPDLRAAPIREQLAKQADVLLAAYTAQDKRACIHLSSWWPDARGKSRD